MKLNLGCWVFKKDGYINIDLDPAFADVVADATQLPYPDDSVEEIYAGHLLEHIKPGIDALKEWHRVLIPGGVLVVTIPDMAKGIELYRAGALERNFLDQIAFGGAEERELQAHHRIYTEDILQKELSAYFERIEVVPQDGILWQSTIKAFKPDANPNAGVPAKHQAA